MTNKQTGIDWLLSQISIDIKMQIGFDLIERAKAKDKETIIQVAKDNCEELGDIEAEEYYFLQFNK